MDTTVQLDEREKGRWRRGGGGGEVEEGRWRRGGGGGGRGRREGEEKVEDKKGKKRGEAEVLLTIMVLFLNSSMMHDLPTSCPAPLQRQRDQLLTFFSLFHCPGFEHFH